MAAKINSTYINECASCHSYFFRVSLLCTKMGLYILSIVLRVHAPIPEEIPNEVMSP